MGNQTCKSYSSGVSGRLSASQMDWSTSPLLFEITEQEDERKQDSEEKENEKSKEREKEEESTSQVEGEEEEKRSEQQEEKTKEEEEEGTAGEADQIQMIQMKFKELKKMKMRVENENEQTTMVVEVHKSENFDTLYYRVGHIFTCDQTSYFVETASMVNKSNHSRAKEKRMIGIIWGPDRKYTSGVQPSICLHSSGIVVEVHKSEYRDTLFRKIGKVVAMTGLTKEEERKSEILNKGIIWSESEKYDSGVTPCIAVNRPGVIVEVHQSSFFSTLYYCVGGINLIDLKMRPSWGESEKYDSGVFPSVSLSDLNVVIEVHQSENYDTCWYRIGQVRGYQIAWLRTGTQYTHGLSPQVTIHPNLPLVYQVNLLGVDTRSEEEKEEQQNKPIKKEICYREGKLLLDPQNHEIHWGPAVTIATNSTFANLVSCPVTIQEKVVQNEAVALLYDSEEKLYLVSPQNDVAIYLDKSGERMPHL